MFFLSFHLQSMPINVGFWDRLIRFFLWLVLLIVWYHLRIDWVQIVFYVIGLFLLTTAAVRRCWIYLLFKTSTCNFAPMRNKVKILLFSLIIVLVWWSGVLCTTSLSRVRLIDDLHEVNDAYKELVFDTEKWNTTEAIIHYKKLMSVFGEFYDQDKNHIPTTIRNDTQFDADLDSMKTILESVQIDMSSSDLSAVASKLTSLDDILHNIVQRNWLSVSF